MKKFILLTQILLLSLLMACESDTPALPSESKATAGNISTRSNTTETLGEGSRILLNAHGGLTIENELFTYNNGAWSNENEYKWEDAEETTHIMALYPHDATSPYNGDALKDILIAQATLAQGETNVSLTFEHLFASFTLNVDETLVDEISSIQLTSPRKVTNISPTTGEITLSESTNTTTLTGNGGSSYTFIIPPMEASIELDITLSNGKNQTYTLQRHRFERGFVYECRLRDWNMVPGIRSAKDLIAFSQLINGKSYGTYKLSDFGEKQADGRMLYRLLADIDFSNIDKDTNSKDLLPIGYYDGPSIMFSDIFDGLGHTISNLTIPDKSTNSKVDKNHSGLFGYISTNGIVRNLRIVNATTVKEPTCNRLGIIAAFNEGIIHNCSVENSTIYCIDDYQAGFICARQLTNAYIFNCYTANNTLVGSSSAKRKGGFVGEGYGYILNSYAYNNTFTKLTSTGTGGGIVGLSSTNPLTIENCYIYHAKSTSYFGIIIGSSSTNTTIKNNFYNKLLPSGTTDNNNQKYDNNFKVNEIHISTLLNQWITNNQSSYDYTFTTWTKDQTGTLPAIFTP